MSRPRPAPTRTRATSQRPRVALALAGGGPLGATYEIGALCALAEALPALDFNRLDHYVGVSAGGFIAASLANDITPNQLCQLFIEGQSANEQFDPAWLMKPAWGEWAQRLGRLPGLLSDALWAWGTQGRSAAGALERLGAALPTGVFDNSEIHHQFERLFNREGRSNRFDQLRTRLTLVATDLDTGAAAPFGQPGWDHVPISRALQASAALPGLFPPVSIDGRHYVDGALKKTVHASVALEEGVDLLLCLNPLVPFRANRASRGRNGIPALVEGGLPAVMSQTFRSLIHSRLALGFKQYERGYPHTDIVLLEPDQGDATLFFANTFSYRQRREIAEHAYRQTRQSLLKRRTELAPKLARHGLALDEALLADDARRLLQPRPARRLQPNPSAPVALHLHAVLDRLQNHLQVRAATA